MLKPTLMSPALMLTAGIFLLQNPTTNADTCGTGDDIACYNGGECRNGSKSYEEIPYQSFLGKVKRGMHCVCPGEEEGTGIYYQDPDSSPSNSIVAKSGYTGVHCDVPFDLCSDGKVCFNGGTCVAEQFRGTEFHCQCPQDPRHKVWAGLSCAIEAEDFCDEDDFYDITGGKWFCTQGGKCINGEKDLSKKCECPAGTFGLHCEFSDEQECSLQCNNGGKCKVGLKDFTKLAEYGLDIAEYLGGQELYGEHCVCPAGFSGVKCETENVARCGSKLCFNGSECVQEIKKDTGEVINEFCRCNSGNDGAFAGRFCEHVATTSCPAPYGHNPDDYFCTNGGQCPINPHEACQCVNGFTGPKCEIPPGGNNDSSFICNLVCENGGECFFGQSPEIDSELQDIQNKGLSFLVDNKHCRCQEGFAGLRCEIDKKKSKCKDYEHFCVHGLECISDSDQYTCDCRDAAKLLTSHGGDFCDNRAAEFCTGPGDDDKSFCSGRGKCFGNIGVGDEDIRCFCEEGWTGKYCELEGLGSKNVASRTFTGFLATLFAIGSVFGGILLLQRWRKRDGDIEYEQPCDGNRVHNPYGDIDSDLSDEGSDQEDGYEFKEVAII